MFLVSLAVEVDNKAVDLFWAAIRLELEILAAPHRLSECTIHALKCALQPARGLPA